MPMQFTTAELANAHYDSDGVFHLGHEAEFAMLRAMGYRDASLGRLYEGHCNATLLLARYGTVEQRAGAAESVQSGGLFGVWNSQAAEPVRIERQGEKYLLRGAKTWASGADSVAYALITASLPTGAKQLCLIPAAAFRTQIDDSAWEPLGMQDSRSFRVSFDGIELFDGQRIGAPDEYEREPWFFGGAVRFAAVHTGIISRVVHETIAFCIARERQGDVLVRDRLAKMRIAEHTCDAWLAACRDARQRYDAERSPEHANQVVDCANMARIAVERAGLEALELMIATVSAGGMLEPLPFSKLFRDLHTYLRQPAPDAVRLRIADAGIAKVSALRNSAMASSTGCSAAGESAAAIECALATA